MVSPSKGEMNIQNAVKDMKQYIEESTVPIEIVIGTDSQNSSETKYVVVLAMYRVGQGGRFFYQVVKRPLVYNLRQKIYQETQMTLELAHQVSTIMIEEDVLHDIVIHLDIGTEGKTKELIAEIKGWVNAEGYEAFIKPEAYAACAIANVISK